MTAKLVAPFVPFLAETLWQSLVADVFGSRAAESAHLCDYPAVDQSSIDELLSARMQLVREIVSLGRSADERETEGAAAAGESGSDPG